MVPPSAEARVTHAQTRRSGRRVEVQLETGGSGVKTRTFHPQWLLRNCPSFQEVVPGQKVLPGDGVPEDTRVERAEPREDGRKLEVLFSAPRGHRSVFGTEWLVEHAYSHKAAETRSSERRPPTLQSVSDIPHVDAADLGSDEGVWQWCRHLNRYGLCVVDNVPAHLDAVTRLGSNIAQIQSTIYGELWSVESVPDAVNVAYTSVELCPHVDLVYYESPPGLQFLHCLEFEDSIKGGLSTFVDGAAVAEALRSDHPEHFRTLCEVPATFEKIHDARDHPVYMRYQRPHFQLNHLGELVGLHWAPPFEGVLSVPEEDVDRYYKAYQLYERMLSDALLMFRLQPGQMVSFNNRRMLHGRTEFEEATGKRHLRGTYVNIDDFHNTYNQLRRRFGPKDPVYRVYNGDFQ